MNTQAISAASLIGMDRTQRAGLMQRTSSAAPADHVSEFHNGMHGLAAANTGERLEKGRLQLLPARDLTVLCLAGELWITRDGDAEDYILGPGQRMTIGRDDQAAVQALQPSHFRLIHE